MSSHNLSSLDIAMAPGGALAPLASLRQFVTYRLEPDDSRIGKVAKRPCRWDTGEISNAQDPANWTDYTTAAAHAHLASGVGFVFTENDPFWFLDVDHALQADGTWRPLVPWLYAQLPGVAWEISQSGTGLHAFGQGDYPDGLKVKNSAQGVELYRAGRFVALTGNIWAGTERGSASMHAPGIANVALQLFEPTTTSCAPQQWTTEAVEGWDATLGDDDELLRRMLKPSTTDTLGSRDGSALRWTARQLWEGDVPSDQRSEADAALASRLAFWTGKNCERIRNLMERSALVRPKWNRADYLPRTIIRACGLQTAVATGWIASPSASPPPTLDGIIFDGESPIEAPRELVKGLLPFDGIAFLAGQSGAGKTFIAVSLAVALASANDE